jgi:hypothetical protein
VTPTRAPELDRRLPRILLGVALALPVLLVVGVLVASQLLGRQTDPDPSGGPLALAAVPVPAAASADCSRLFSGLPLDINTGEGLLSRRVLAAPVPAGTMAWGGERESSGRPEDQPVVLRCGLASPPELGPTSPLLDVDGVDWLRIPGDGTTTWVTTDRAIFIGLTLPDGIGSGAIQDVSRGVKITLVSRDSTPPAPAPPTPTR